ncbi:RHS repeat-associated core domain-containing protein [Enterobacter chuandaensis]
MTRHVFNVPGFLASSADPRLRAVGNMNVTNSYDVTGNLLYTASADTGICITLADTVGRPLIKISNMAVAEKGWENFAQAITQTWLYGEVSVGGRLLAVSDAAAGGTEQISERFVYAGLSPSEKERNLAGQCVSHYDTAGLLQRMANALTGIECIVSRRMLKEDDRLDTPANWQGPDPVLWDEQLTAESFTTQTQSDATGCAVIATDAAGHQQRRVYDRQGMLRKASLAIRGETERCIISSLRYSAAGQTLSEEHGNGVVTTFTREPYSQRLIRIKTERPSGHAAGEKVLQDRWYEYDPTGNVLSVENHAEEYCFWRNQKVVPGNTFTYDSLYQLVSATGVEMVSAGQQGRALPSVRVPLPADNSIYTNYSRYYRYDRGGNLIHIRHHSPATDNSYTIRMTLSDNGNRGVLSSLTSNPEDVNTFFTACGQQTQLQSGQRLTWTMRRELEQVITERNENAAGEYYRYDANSRRILKVSLHNTETEKRVIYLPELELHMKSQGNEKTEKMQIISPTGTDLPLVKVLHWESGKPEEINNNQIRFSYPDLIGSSGLEVDEYGHIITLETYYPYGGTATWAARSLTEADYKTTRYSGKERDVTGLYYYGYRYYQPWAGRWLSADPAGTVDGLNLYSMVQNNPVTFVDRQGLIKTPPPLQQADVSGIQDIDELMSIDFSDFAAMMNNPAGDFVDIFGQIPDVQLSPHTSEPTAPSLYFRHGLETFLSRDASANTRLQAVHRLTGTWIKTGYTVKTVESTYQSDLPSEFVNTYEPEMWTFKRNFRFGSGATPENTYYASDVARHQYEFIAREKGFYGQLPSRIVREHVVNEDTLRSMGGQNIEDLQTFLRTPNGRSTVRIMDQFGLKATGLSRNLDTFTLSVATDPAVRFSNGEDMLPRPVFWRPWQNIMSGGSRRSF